VVLESNKGGVAGSCLTFYNRKPPKESFSSYFITLIPKVDSPIRIGDFRPISLVCSLHKLVDKVLARRLAKVMDELIFRLLSEEENW
jgi:hypothetical protein